MSQTMTSPALPARRARRLSFAWLAERLLARMVAGRLSVRLPDGRTLTAAGAAPGPEATVILQRWRPLRRLLIEGDIGFAEAYVDGDWTTPDLAALLEVGARNQNAIGFDAGFAVRLLRRLAHRRRDNTRSGSRRNVRAHYDIGNEFYREWLDSGMTYSSALYTRNDESLEDAQVAKLDAMIAALSLAGGEQVLEIGCGWGSLAERLAARGASVTGLTLSPAQRAYATARMAASGFAAGVELRLQDYRDVTGRFDRIVSVEMLEAVGEAYWPTFFRRLAMCLVPDGIGVLQFISIAEDRFDAYRAGVDFIQAHIFPGGLLPTVTAMQREAERAGLVLETVTQFAASYAATLAEWRRRFHAAWPRIAARGFDERFRRKWEYYLAYCEAGFRSGLLNVGIYRLHPLHAGPDAPS